MFTDRQNQDLTIESRIFRGVLGSALIVYTMLVPTTPLGWLAVLPLLAIYPMFTAITGLNPVKTFFREPGVVSHALHLSVYSRGALAAIGAAAISSVYLVEGTVGYLALLPLLGIYPIFAAIIGQDPVTTLFNMDMVEEGEEVSLTEVTPVTEKPKYDDHYHRAA